MPRPKKEPAQTRPHMVSFRLTDAEMQQLRDEAAKAALAPNECARAKSVGIAQGGALRSVPSLVLDTSFEQREALLRIGNNMNQIARRLNINGEHEPAELRDASLHLDELLVSMLSGRRRR